MKHKGGRGFNACLEKALCKCTCSLSLSLSHSDALAGLMVYILSLSYV